MNQIEKIKKEFTKQAKNFENYQKSFSKEKFNKWAIEKINFDKSENVLEVAAGTCALGRMVSPFVKTITELDATKAMLDVGRNEAEKEGIFNLSFKEGIAEKLPFSNDTFDTVMSRLAFHHFLDIDIVFSEMVRVLKSNGKLVIIDMEARDENLREVADKLETMRDNSHTKCVSRKEFISLAEKNSMSISVCEMIPIPVSLTAWMELTKVPDDTRVEIRKAMQVDIDGGKQTGFEPYMSNGEIYFNHKWLLIVAQKN